MTEEIDVDPTPTTTVFVCGVRPTFSVQQRRVLKFLAQVEAGWGRPRKVLDKTFGPGVNRTLASLVRRGLVRRRDREFGRVSFEILDKGRAAVTSEYIRG